MHCSSFKNSWVLLVFSFVASRLEGFDLTASRLDDSACFLLLDDSLFLRRVDVSPLRRDTWVQAVSRL